MVHVRFSYIEITRQICQILLGPFIDISGWGCEKVLQPSSEGEVSRLSELILLQATDRRASRTAHVNGGERPASDEERRRLFDNFWEKAFSGEIQSRIHPAGDRLTYRYPEYTIYPLSNQKAAASKIERRRFNSIVKEDLDKREGHVIRRASGSARITISIIKAFLLPHFSHREEKQMSCVGLIQSPLIVSIGCACM